MKQLLFGLTKWVKFQKLDETVTISEVHELIKNGTFKTEITAIRKYLATAKVVESENLKKQLPAISFSAVFNGSRTTANIEYYTGIIALDIDNLDPLTLKQTKERAVAMDNSVLVFESPSGTGLKIIVFVNSSIEQHELVFNQVCNLYDEELGVKADRSTRDVPRLCFLSYDPNCYFNPDALIFEVAAENVNNSKHTATLSTFENSMQYAISYTGNLVRFEAENRNNFIFSLACNCNRLGLPKVEVLEYILRHYTRPDFLEKEIRASVDSPYKNYKKDFGTWNLPKSQCSKQVEHVKQVDVARPLEHKAIHENRAIDSLNESKLINRFKTLSQDFKTSEERESFLLGCLASALISRTGIEQRFS